MGNIKSDGPSKDASPSTAPDRAEQAGTGVKGSLVSTRNHDAVTSI
jgi:hypothetical protein